MSDGKYLWLSGFFAGLAVALIVSYILEVLGIGG
jgi:hypothetical protein